MSETAADRIQEQIIDAAIDCVRHDVAPEWQRSALRNRLRVILNGERPAPAASPAAEPVATVEVGGMEHGPFTFQTTPYGVDTLPKGVHSLYIAAQPNADCGCNKPPHGWVCTREEGHEGPCAAKPVENGHGITSEFKHGVSGQPFTRRTEADKLLEALEPFMDSLICYASTMSEYDGNRIAYEVDRYFKDKSNYERPLIAIPNLTPFGLLCRAYRLAIGKSLYEQSQAIGLRAAALSSIEFGRRKMTDAELDAIIRFSSRTVCWSRRTSQSCSAKGCEHHH